MILTHPGEFEYQKSGKSQNRRTSMEDNFLWLFQWFRKQCDGDWEHGHGIHIGTLDNPGWYLSININETECDGKDFKEIIVERSNEDWFHCSVKGGRFEGPCGPFNLPEVLQIFRSWVENIEKS